MLRSVIIINNLTTKKFTAIIVHYLRQINQHSGVLRRKKKIDLYNILLKANTMAMAEQRKHNTAYMVLHTLLKIVTLRSRN